MPEPFWYNIHIVGIPKSEKICLRYYSTNSVLTNVITIDPMKNYKLYELDKLKAIYTKHKNKSPLELYSYLKHI